MSDHRINAERDATYPVTERSRIRRLHQRGTHEAAAVHAVLDAAPLAHVGYMIDGEPYVTPTIHWREGDRVYWHGSAASRFLRKAAGQRVCLTASLHDGYVLARSAFNHSVNYRSVMVFGTAQVLEDPAEIAAALERFTEDLFPGRWPTLRPMTTQELKATAVLWCDIEEASVKARDLPPGDEDESDFPVWAGVIPLVSRLGEPVPAPGLDPALEFAPELRAKVASGRLR